MSGWTGAVAALARAWTRFYTAGLPRELRETRRAEIDSDVWEHRQDAADNGRAPVLAAMDILLRVLAGLRDDLTWRFEANQFRREDPSERRVGFMAPSQRQIRGMGLAGVIGGIIWAGAMLTPLDLGTLVRGYGHIALSLLLIAGLVGFYADRRERLSKTGRAGLILLFMAFAAWLAVNVLGTVFGASDRGLPMNLLAVAWVLLLPPGFVLLGIGTRGGSRIIPLVIGAAFVAWMVVPRTLYAHFFPWVTNWNRGDTPVALTVFALMGIGVALMGVTTFRNSASPPHA